MASLVAQRVKRLPAMQETWIRSLGGEDPWRRQWQPTPVFLPGKPHGWRSLVGYSSWGHKELGMTERLHFVTLNITLSPIDIRVIKKLRLETMTSLKKCEGKDNI